MPLPPINVGAYLNGIPPLGPSELSGPGAPQGPDPSDGASPAVHLAAPPDPDLDSALENGGGPDLQPGNGQGRQFVANHAVAPGRDWDLHSVEGMLETARKSMEHVRAVVSGEAAFREFDASLGAAVARAVADHPGTGAADLADAYAAFKQVFGELRNVRGALMVAVKDGSDCKDPNKALAQIRKTMRVFRFELQQELAKVGHDAGKMDLPEQALRTIQHAFTFGVGSKVSETFARLLSLEARFDEALDGLLDRLRALDPARAVPEPPPGIRLADVVGDALSCVVVARLPFAAVGDPVVSARCEQIDKAGKSSFFTLSLPAAVLRLVQPPPPKMPPRTPCANA